MKSFRNKIVVVTGAASGMGRAYAELFAEEGAILALCDFDEKGLNETAELIQAAQASTKVLTMKVDVSNREQMVAFADKVKAELGNAQVLVNNAGVEGNNRPVWAMDISQIERVMNINFYGVVHGTQAFLPQLMDSEEAALVNVSSLFGLMGTPNAADYCASKFAVRGFTESLMIELQYSHVQVHLVHPGGVATGISRSGGNEDFKQRFLKSDAKAISREVINGIKKDDIRIICAHQARSSMLGIRFLPLRWLQKLIWMDMGRVVDKTHYPDNIRRKPKK